MCRRASLGFWFYREGRRKAGVLGFGRPTRSGLASTPDWQTGRSIRLDNAMRVVFRGCPAGHETACVKHSSNVSPRFWVVPGCVSCRCSESNGFAEPRSILFFGALWLFTKISEAGHKKNIILVLIFLIATISCCFPLQKFCEQPQLAKT